jgi:hypothetical protein
MTIYWNGCGRKWSSPNLRYNPGIFLQRLSKTTKTSFLCSCSYSVELLDIRLKIHRLICFAFRRVFRDYRENAAGGRAQTEEGSCSGMNVGLDRM